MKQIGMVIKADENTATVLIKRVTQCGENCAHCGGHCENSKLRVIVDNKIGARAGDTVKLEAEDTAVLKGAFIVYFIPVIIMIAGFLATYYFTHSNKISTAVMLVCLTIAFFAVSKLDKKIAPKTEMTQIISGDDGYGS